MNNDENGPDRLLNRRAFIRQSGVAACVGLAGNFPLVDLAGTDPVKLIKVTSTNSNFERETLIRPFGFKGGYMTEMWQTASRLASDSGKSVVGICTQNVLYADADVFAACSEAGGNALMYSLTEKALHIIRRTAFRDPIDLIDQILPEVYREGQNLTGKAGLNKLFALNALISTDNAAWLLYAAENKFSRFDQLIPAPYRKALSYRNTKVAIMYLASYNLPMEDLKKAVQQGYFVIKIKIGQPGTQDEMLQKDMARLTEVHQAIKDVRTSQTKTGKLVYTLDANGRYERKATFARLLDHARKIGALDQILFVEEPLQESNEENVADLSIRVAADESAHDEAGALRRLDQGYSALVLKGIAKTLSLSMKMAKLAYDRGVPCLCADLTVNPILIDWHKNLAARLAPFPTLDMGIMETNGDLNYLNWQRMLAYRPYQSTSWTEAKDGVFTLDADFYAQSGGIFQPSDHFQAMVKSK